MSVLRSALTPLPSFKSLSFWDINWLIDFSFKILLLNSVPINVILFIAADGNANASFNNGIIFKIKELLSYEQLNEQK